METTDRGKIMGLTIGIGIPSLQQGAYISDCLASIQCKSPLSVFVADAGSTDETLAILREYDELANLEWQSEPDLGQADAINKALGKVDGDVLCYMNSDDMYLPGALDRVATIFENEPVDILFGWALNMEGTKHGWGWGPKGGSLEELSWLPVAFEPATFWRREVWEAEGPFRTDMDYVFGWDFLCRAVKTYRTRILEEPLAVNRLHSARKTETGGERRAQEIFKLVQQYGPEDKTLQYQSILTLGGDWRLRLLLEMNQFVPLQEVAYRTMFRSLSKQMNSTEALRISRVLRGR